jgi:hypothetical protein
MALSRLKRVLESRYSIRLQSNQRIIKRVNVKIGARAKKLAAKKKSLPTTKAATAVPIVEAQGIWQIRAIDLLHKIGYLTTPSWINMAQLSASWATRRYFWAIADGIGGNQNFRLSADARLIDFHQKTLLSDEFGIGMAGLILERFFAAPSFADVSLALNDPAVYQDVEQIGEAEPDYLMWGEDPGSPYYVVECKGCQTNSSTSMDQLRRGLEQVPSLAFGQGSHSVVALVVATCLEEDQTTVYVLDPEDAPEDSRHDKDEVSERTEKRSWKITNPQVFEKRLRLSQESELLKWAGQFATATDRDRRFAPQGEHFPRLPDFELEILKTRTGSYRGYTWPLFPELNRELKVFSGVDEELLARARESSPTLPEVARAVQHRVSEIHMQLESPYQSISRSGTCMAIEGIE